MKRLEWISAAAGILLLFIAGFGCIFFFASKENTKNITKEETFVYRAETDSTSLADTSAGIYANGKVQTKIRSVHHRRAGALRIFTDLQQLNIAPVPAVC